MDANKLEETLISLEKDVAVTNSVLKGVLESINKLSDTVTKLAEVVPNQRILEDKLESKVAVVDDKLESIEDTNSKITASLKGIDNRVHALEKQKAKDDMLKSVSRFFLGFLFSGLVSTIVYIITHVGAGK